jgi:carbamoyl-phosphate synthase large subunit
MRILTEASGSLTSSFIIKAIRDASHEAIASDITPDVAGRFLADDFILMPTTDDPDLWDKVTTVLIDEKVDMVIPSLDEMLLGWSHRKEAFHEKGIHVVVSDQETIRLFQDKWLTHTFFTEHQIPAPETSLEQRFPLVKPRNGRGGAGVVIADHPVNMSGMISQETLTGEEYTIDVFCDRESNPVYTVPRKRLAVKDGKSTAGVVVNHPEITTWVYKICKAAQFLGPVNIQCFVNGEIIGFTEINPRIAGGMALGFAATENWIKLMVEHYIENKPIHPKPISYGMRMLRYYAEVFVPGH